jgi:class 3 adenylate cyclase
MFKIPNFSNDEEAVNDYLDIVADQFEKMSRGEEDPDLYYEDVADSQSGSGAVEEEGAEESKSASEQQQQEDEATFRKSYEAVKDFIKTHVGDLSNYRQIEEVTGMKRVEGGQGDSFMVTWICPNADNERLFKEQGRAAIHLSNASDIQAFCEEHLRAMLEREEEAEAEISIEAEVNESGLLVLKRVQEQTDDGDAQPLEVRTEVKRGFLRRMATKLTKGKKSGLSSPTSTKISHAAFLMASTVEQEPQVMLSREECIERMQNIDAKMREVMQDDESITDADYDAFTLLANKMIPRRLSKLSGSDVNDVYQSMKKLADKYDIEF